VVQRLVVGTVGLTVVFLVLGWMLGTHFVAAETAVIDQVAGIRSGPLTVLAKALTMVGSLLVLGPVAAGVAGWCAYRRRGGAELGVVSAAVGAVVVVDVVKAVVDRPRPMTQHVVQVASASFPSQHAAQAAAILPALALVLTTAHTWMRAWALVVAGVLIVGIGVSRVYLGVHYPSDVVAGWVLGLVWTAWVRHAAPPVHPRAHPLG
jgi:undecaprenyl-diphosphatase